MRKILTAFFLLLPTAAFADKIDGAWCTGVNTRIEINGPQISLGGKPGFDGVYKRHEFTYTVPASEDHAGDQIYMRLLNDENMTSFTIKDSKPVDPVEWKRCQSTS